MYVKVHTPKEYGNNTGSSESIFDYLEKENSGKEITDHRSFFSHHEEGFGVNQVTNIIDNNKRNLGKDDSKFFMLSVNPSEKELGHLVERYGEDKMDVALKHYTRQVMDEYAKNFNRVILHDTGEKYSKDNPEYKDKIVDNEKLLELEKGLKKELGKLKGEKFEAQRAIKKEELKEVQEKFHLGGDAKRILEGAKIKVVDRQLSGGDLVYFAKIETERTYKPEDKQYQDIFKANREIQKEINSFRESIRSTDAKTDLDTINKLNRNINQLEKSYIKNSEGTTILPHAPKDGKNYHVHVVVSRKDMTQTLKLDPLTNSKGSYNMLNGEKVQIGFNRDKFAERAEKAFDKEFTYERELEESYRYRYNKVHDSEKAIKQLMAIPKDEKELARRLVRELTKDSDLVKSYNKIPKNVHQLRDKALSKAVDNVAAAMKLNPGGLATTVAKKIIRGVFNDMSGAMDIVR